MVYFNHDQQEFNPVGSRSDLAWMRESEGGPHAEDGLYFRERIFPELSEKVDLCLNGEMQFADLTLDALQAWNERGWKEPHASFAAVSRFDNKLTEEQRELDDALEEYFDTRDPGHLVEELGDINWVSTAQASNGGANISDGIKKRLYDYAMGTRQFRDGGAHFPDWYDAATQMAIKRGPVTIGEIDGLLDNGFFPQHSPAMNLWDDEPVSATGYVFDIMFYKAALRNLLLQQYDEDREQQGNVFWNPEVAGQISTVAAEVYFRTAYIAHFAGSTLAAVVQGNVEKISNRVETRSVDRTDGTRKLQ